MKRLNLTNKTFGRLIAKQPTRKNNRTAWICNCECGNVVTIVTSSLTTNKTKSCGCLNAETRLKRIPKMCLINTKYKPHISSAKRIWKQYYNDGISFEEFLELSQKECFYCGQAPNNSYNSQKNDRRASQFSILNGTFVYNGLDRIDSGKTHTINNIVPCCKHCNYAKRDRSINDFKNWVINIYNNFVLK